MSKQQRPSPKEPSRRTGKDSKPDKKLEQAQREAAEDRKKGGYQ
jgi:hypothetical protein